MKNIQTKSIAIFAALIMLMAMTRYNHFGSSVALPDASYAVFFLGGLYLGRVRGALAMLALLLVEAALVDYYAINFREVSSWCVTSAYGFLVLAYSALWLAGRWYAAHYQLQARNLPQFAAAVLLGSASCELISSGSFYFLGGQYADTSLIGFASVLLQYFPRNLGNLALYLAVAALIHTLIASKQHDAVATR